MSDNTKKQKAGQDFKRLLTSRFSELLGDGIIKSFERGQNFSHIGFSYSKQYRASFIIETLDEKFIIISSSNSFKSDRHKQYTWDIQGIIQNSEISDRIVASVILYANAEKDNSTFVNFRKQIAREEAYSPASHLLTVDELLEFLENYSADVQSKLAQNDQDETEEGDDGVLFETLSDTASIKATAEAKGSAYGKKGILHEKQLVHQLNQQKMLKQFKAGTLNTAEPFTIILNTVCKFKGIKADDIIKVIATDTVPLLQNGGNAKTDIILTIHTTNEVYIETFSAKLSTQTRVSCHDYPASSFIDILGCKNTQLASYLLKFQQEPTYKRFNAALTTSESVQEFEKLMAPHAQRLTEWALSGAHDNQNMKSPEKQISRYLFVQQPNGAFCFEIGFYIRKLFETQPLKFGVPFSWTYPSKQGGKRIQLKVPLVNFVEN